MNNATRATASTTCAHCGGDISRGERMQRGCHWRCYMACYRAGTLATLPHQVTRPGAALPAGPDVWGQLARAWALLASDEWPGSLE